MSEIKFIRIFDKNNNFYSKSILFTVLSLLAAIFNYALYLVVARVLSVGSFGEFSALLALVTQIGAIMLAFNIISIYLVTKYGEKEAKRYLATIQKCLIYIFGAISLLTIFLFPVISNILNLSSFSDALILAGILLCTIPAAIWSGYFQGNGEIVKVGAFSLFTAGAKLILAAFGAYFWGISGALTGVLAGTLVGLLIFWLLPGSKPPLANTLQLSNKDIVVFRKFSTVILRCVAAVGLLSIFQIFDLLSVKALYSSEAAGQYAGISTISRIVFYVGFIIVWVLLPEIAKSQKKHRKRLIVNSYLLYSAIAIISSTGAIIAGGQAIEVLLGRGYAVEQSVVVWAVIFQSAILFLSFQSFVLAVLNKKVVVYLVLGLLGLLLCSIFVNQSVLSLIRSFALCTIVLSVGLGILINRQSANEKEIN